MSIEKSDVLVKTAIDEGAYGAKMSGGGLGGCIIALMESKEKAEMTGKKLMEKGAVNIWYRSIVKSYANIANYKILGEEGSYKNDTCHKQYFPYVGKSVY